MRWFFENLNKQEELLTEMKSWLGTPYRHQCGVKNLGVDCIYFVAHCYSTVGALKGKIPTIPKYAKDWHLHKDGERLLEGIIDFLDAQSVSIDRPMNGDLVLFRFGRQISHCSIYFNNYIYQCISDIGVERRRWDDKDFFNRKKFNLRIKA